MSFFTSAGASAAYLTVSDVFPLETGALCIAVFYAVGTGIGGVIGPQVFSRMINTESYEQVFLALGLGAVIMILGGLAELVFGVNAERQSLESIAKPPTVEDSPRGALSPHRPVRSYADGAFGGGHDERELGVGRATAQAFAREGTTVG